MVRDNPVGDAGLCLEVLLNPLVGVDNARVARVGHRALWEERQAGNLPSGAERAAMPAVLETVEVGVMALGELRCAT